MRLTDVLRRSGRSLLSAKTRTILTSFAIAVGAFALTLTLAASNGAQNYADTLIRNNFDPSQLIVTGDQSLFNKADTSNPQEYNANSGSITNQAGASRTVKLISDSDLSTIKGVRGVESVEPVIQLSLQYLTRDGMKKYSATIQAFNPYRKPALLAGSIPPTIANHTLILPEGYVSALGFKDPKNAIGQQVRLAMRKTVDQSAILAALTVGGPSAAAAQNAANTTEETFTVIAVTAKASTQVQPGTELYLYSNSDSVIELNDATTKDSANYHKYLSSLVKVTDGTNSTKLKDVQDRLKKLGYGAQSVKDTQATLTQIITVLQGIVLVFGLIAVIASVFGVVNTMYISVLQRTREIGLMKALGMHKRDISSLFRYEAALIGLLGGSLGAFGAFALGTVLNPLISKQLGLGEQRLLDFRVGQIGLLILALVVIAIIAGLLPARKAAQLDPIAALRTE